MQAIVTGGAGFIGSHVADALCARGAHVTVVDDLSSGRRENVPKGADLEVRDIREPLDDLFDELHPQLCFHLAAHVSVSRSVQDPVRDAEVNVLGTLRVLQAALRQRTQVVFASSGGAIYGECEGPAAEDSELRPFSPYGASKLAAEEYIATFNRLHGTRHVSLRYANVYGPRQDSHGEGGVVAIFLSRLARGERPQIFDDGLLTRDYVYVGDVVEATVAAASTAHGVFNVGTGIETTVVELFERCRTVTGVDVEPEFAPPRPGDLRRNVVDPGRAERVLGWRAQTSLDEGLARTWAFFGKESAAAR